MEYIGIGICLIMEAFFFKKKTVLETGGEPSSGVILFMILFGGFFVLIGFLGVVLGAASIIPSVRGSVVLFIAFFYLVVSCRLLSLAITDDYGVEFLKKKDASIFCMTKAAFSIGLFPKSRPYWASINIFQILLFLVVISFVKGILWQ